MSVSKALKEFSSLLIMINCVVVVTLITMQVTDALQSESGPVSVSNVGKAFQSVGRNCHGLVILLLESIHIREAPASSGSPVSVADVIADL